MSGSVDDYLKSERSGGALENEGSFSINLREAARKMAVFGQSERSLWTLKFGQAFQRLECRTLELAVTSDAWYLDGLEGLKELDLRLLRESLSKLGLEGGQSAETFLAVGLSALSVPADDGKALEAACWVHQDRIEHILGEVEEVPASLKGQALVLQFEKGSAPALPQSAWENHFSYSTMEIYYWLSHQRLLLNNTYSTQFMAPRTELLWLEYLGAGVSLRDLTLTPTGRAMANIGETSYKNKQNYTARLRWKGTTQRQRSIVILATDGLKGPTEIYPVVAGCVLEPFVDHGLCDGFKIILTADDCPTDLGHNQLRKSPELEALIESCKPPLLHAIELMLSSTSEKKSPTVVKKPKTPFLADAAPGCMGLLGLVSLPVIFSEPIVGSLITAFFGGPSGFYFWYSRRQRGKEFDELKSEAGEILEERKKALEQQGDS
jgi:hypothetical protein